MSTALCIDTALQVHLNWPEIQDAPIDEFRTAGSVACAFPKLFPIDDADFRQGRMTKITDLDYFKHQIFFLIEDSLFVRKNLENYEGKEKTDFTFGISTAVPLFLAIL